MMHGTPDTVPETHSGRSVPKGAPQISVIVCSHNRSHMLEICVRSILRNAGLGPDRYELLVVENNCCDATVDRIGVLAGLHSMTSSFAPISLLRYSPVLRIGRFCPSRDASSLMLMRRYLHGCETATWAL